MNLFIGSPLDIYVHWLIFSLGIGVLLSGSAVLASCRSFANLFHLNSSKNSKGRNFYKKFFKYHSIYWIIFWLILVLHLMVTITHVGLPVEPFFRAHQVVFITSLINLIFVLLILFSCRSFSRVLNFLTSKDITKNRGFKKFYRLHSYFWLILITSFVIHISFGLIHAINT